MDKLPKLPKIFYSDSQKEKLKRWYSLWDFNKKATFGDDEQSSAPPVELKITENLIKPFDSNPKESQIRLLSSELFSDENNLRYVLILEENKDDLLTVVPYSPFSVGATQGELETGFPHFALSNLCLWNVLEMPKQVLAKSWLIDEAPTELIKDANSVLEFILYGDELPEHLLERTGPPILHSQDPRLIYQKEERAIFSKLRNIYTDNKVLGSKEPVPFPQYIVKHAEDIEYEYAAKSSSTLGFSKRLTFNGISLKNLKESIAQKESACLHLESSGILEVIRLTADRSTLMWKWKSSEKISGAVVVNSSYEICAYAELREDLGEYDLVVSEWVNQNSFSITEELIIIAVR